MDNEERISQLEIRYTYLEDMCNTLNDVIVRKDSEIEDLRMRLKRLEQAMENSDIFPDSEKPPHY